MWTESLTRKIREIKADVNRFRACLDELHDTLEHTFLAFPKGCCGAASELLAAFLKDRGYGKCAYISGWSENCDEGSHAWLELDGFIIDVTIDQFSHEAPKPMVSSDWSFHEKFNRKREIRPDGDFRIAGNPAHLSFAYRRVLNYLINDKCSNIDS